MMEEKYRNLAAACNIFTEEYDLSVDQNISSLDLSIKQGYIDYQKLNNEFCEAISDPDFEWLDFAIKSKMIIYNIDQYDNEKVKNIVLNVIGGYLTNDFR